MFQWIEAHEAELWSLAGFSLVMFVATLIFVPAILIRIPADYFTSKRRQELPFTHLHPAVQMTLLILKNALGYLFLLVGVAMLVLPGQGALTIAVGLMFLDFPGKYRLERWVVSRPPVLRSINWLRREVGRPPIVLE